MKRIGVFVDVGNLYYCLGKKFDGRKLDYQKYIDFIKDQGDIEAAIAYGTQKRGEAIAFIHCLEQLGFTTKFHASRRRSRRNVNWNIGMTLDIVNTVNRFDLVIIGSSEIDLVPLVEWLKNRSIEVVTFACGIPRDLKDSVDHWIEIFEALLEEPKETELKPVPEITDFQPIPQDQGV